MNGKFSEEKRMVFVVNNSMKLSSADVEGNDSELNNLNGNSSSPYSSTTSFNIVTSSSSIPKSPSFHSGLDLVANSKNVNISKFNFTTTTATSSVDNSLDSINNININSYNMNGNNQKSSTSATSSSSSVSAQQQQTVFSFSKVRFIQFPYLVKDVIKSFNLKPLSK
jgi:hypothetical protein